MTDYRERRKERTARGAVLSGAKSYQASLNQDAEFGFHSKYNGKASPQGAA